MVKKNKYKKISPQIQDEAMMVAKATQRPGQTKEQTKLIAQGIEKGISHYKKQQKGKSRELNKKLNKASQQLAVSDKENEVDIQCSTVYKQAFLPWALLMISWTGFIAFFFMG